MTWVTFHHLVSWLKAGICDLGYWELFMVGLLSRDDWGIGSQGKVDTWVGHQVSLELCQIHIKCSIETQGCCDRTHNLTNQPRNTNDSLYYSIILHQDFIKFLCIIISLSQQCSILLGFVCRITPITNELVINRLYSSRKNTWLSRSENLHYPSTAYLLKDVLHRYPLGARKQWCRHISLFIWLKLKSWNWMNSGPVRAAFVKHKY